MALQTDSTRMHIHTNTQIKGLQRLAKYSAKWISVLGNVQGFCQCSLSNWRRFNDMMRIG